MANGLRRESTSPLRSMSNKSLPLYQLEYQTASAYSLRKLRYGVKNAIRVRRSSDDAERDIAFVGDYLDVATLLAFSSGTSAYVTTWYDQSGNGNHATQSTAANQPRIVNAGAIEMFNLKPMIRYIRAGDAVANPNLSLSVFSQGALTQPNVISTIFNFFGALSTLSYKIYDGYADTSNRNMLQYVPTTSKYVGFAGSLAEQVGSKPDDNKMHTCSMYFNGATSKVYFDGMYDSFGVSPGTQGLGGLTIGARATTLIDGFDGYISELIIFNSILSDSQRQKLERNQGKYYGITVV